MAERADRIVGPGFLTDQLENLPVEVLHSRHLQRPVLAECGLLGNSRSVSLMKTRSWLLVGTRLRSHSPGS